MPRVPTNTHSSPPSAPSGRRHLIAVLVLIALAVLLSLIGADAGAIGHTGTFVGVR
jgi:hypothetical protein